MKISAIDIRPGTALDYEGKIWVVNKIEIMQPGKGASVIQVEMRDVRAGNKNNVRFRTQESVERVQLDTYEYDYLYREGDELVFMQKENFEQIRVPTEVLGDRAAFLQEGMVCEIQTYENEPISVTLPVSAVFSITECEPVVKGQTASSSYKPAVLDNGARIMVPPFVENGTKVVVRLETGEYMERFKG